MSTTVKVLIITWLIIGFVIVGVAGFLLGRMTAGSSQTQTTPGIMQPQPGNQFPSNGIQQNPQQGGQQNFQQPPTQMPTQPSTQGPNQGTQQNNMKY